MTSRLVVNNIDNDTGVTTIRLNPTYASFELNNAERLRINSSGNGNVILTGGYSLRIDGPGEFSVYESNTSLSLNNSAQIALDFSNNIARVRSTASGSGSNRPLALCIGTSEKFRIATDGKVGINSTSPKLGLDINKGANSGVFLGNPTHGYQLRANVTSSHDYGLVIEDEDGVDLYRAVASTGSSNENTHTWWTAGNERLKIKSSGNVNINKSVGIQTSSVEGTDLVGAGTSFFGAYIGDGMLAFHNRLDNSAGYYVAAHVNALNAGPVTLGSTMTLDGTWVIV